MKLTSEQSPAKQKAQAMFTRIVEECQRQKFTFYEFEWLTLMLSKSLGDTVEHIHNNDYDDLFYPFPIDESPKTMVTLVGEPNGSGENCRSWDKVLAEEAAKYKNKRVCGGGTSVR